MGHTTLPEDNKRVEYRVSEVVSLAAISDSHSKLLFPPPLSQSNGKPINEPLIGITALHKGKPIGLILCEHRVIESARILCWSVLPAFRNQGVGSALLQHAEQAVANTGKHTLAVSFRSDWPSLSIVDKILRKSGWSPAQEILRLYKVTKDSFVEPSWFSHINVCDGYSLFPWGELTYKERNEILERQEREEWYPAELTPFQEESKIEWANSLGLRFRDEVVGWIITHRVAPGVIQYTSLFVSPELQPLGRAFPLIVESARRHYSLSADRAIFQTRSHNRALIAFVDRRLSNILAISARRLSSKKEL